MDFNDLMDAKPMTGYEVMITPQYDDPIIDVLNNIFEDMKGIKKNTDKKYRQLCKKMSEAITHRFGIPVTVKYDYDMFACIPPLAGDSVLTPVENDDAVKSSRGRLKELHSISDDVVINLNKAYVSGLSDKTSSSLYLGLTEINNPKLKPVHLTAILIHEIGHLFTYIYHSDKVIKNNISLLESFLYSNGGMVSKGEVTLSKHFNNGKDKDLPKVVSSKVIKDLSKVSNVVLGMSNTNGKDSETEADAFTTRFGLGSELTFALLNILNLNKAIKNTLLINLYAMLLETVLIDIQVFFFLGTHMFLGAFTIVLINTLGTVVILAALTMMFGTIIEIFNLNPNAFPYTKVSERINRIKTELIKILRDNKISKDDRLKTINSIDNLLSITESEHLKGYDSIVAAVFLDPFNYGKDINIEKVMNNTMNSLENNDLHYLGEKVKAGNESDTMIYYTEVDLWSENYIGLKIKEDSSVLNIINDVLLKYNINLSWSDKTDSLIIKSDKIYRVEDGITTLAFLSKDEKEDVITISTDWFKTVWHIVNPYVEIYDVNKVKIAKEYCFYITRLKRYTTEDNVTKNNKDIRELNEYNHKQTTEFGIQKTTDVIAGMIKHIKDRKLKINKETVEQLNLLRKTLLKYDPEDRNGFDLHRGNFMLNRRNKTVLLDPVFSRNRNATKLNNCVELPKNKEK